MEISDKDINKFKQYVAKHVLLVTKLGKLAFNKNYRNHDRDKTEASGSYLEALSLKNKQYNTLEEFSAHDEKLVNEAVGFHVKHNKHHPEYWDEKINQNNFDYQKPPTVHAERMPEEALMEMCCDWVAVAIKLNQPIAAWYNKTIDSRFIFTEMQKQFIKNCMDVLIETVASKDIRFPGYGTYNAQQIPFKENKEKIAALSFGRLNPFTTGHLLVCEKLHNLLANQKFLYLSHTQDKPNKKDPLKCKNPLPYDLKFLYAETFLKESAFNDIELMKSPAKTIIDVLKEVYLKGFESVKIVVGSDRLDDFTALVNKYNNVTDSVSGEVMYSFKHIDVINAGNRVESGNSVAAMSASKVRQYAVENNFNKFREGIPVQEDDIALDLFNDIRYYMGVI